MDHTYAEKDTHTIRYQDCILGKIGTPKEKKRKMLFQIVALSLSMPFTATIAWLIQSAAHISWADFLTTLYLYPLTFGIAILVRFLIANPVSDKVTQKYISPRVEGLKKALSITLLNIFIMATVIGLVRTVILAVSGDTLVWSAFVCYLPLSYFVSFLFGYFVITPLLKKAFMVQDSEGIRSRPLKHPRKFIRRHFSHAK